MKYIVNKSVGYELSGVIHPVDAEIELPEDVAAADVARGFLVPKEAPPKQAPPKIVAASEPAADAESAAKTK